MSKLFIIEDEMNILASLEAKFGILGYEVIGNAGDGDIDEIINKIKMEMPSFIILDLILPKVDGLEIIRALKGNLDTNYIPIIVFTDLSDADAKARSEKFGIEFYFIKKEWMIDDFVEKVTRITTNYEKSHNR